jgi:hypothetical protein
LKELGGVRRRGILDTRLCIGTISAISKMEIHNLIAGLHRWYRFHAQLCLGVLAHVDYLIALAVLRYYCVSDQDFYLRLANSPYTAVQM